MPMVEEKRWLVDMVADGAEDILSKVHEASI